MLHTIGIFPLFPIHHLFGSKVAGGDFFFLFIGVPFCDAKFPVLILPNGSAAEGIQNLLEANCIGHNRGIRVSVPIHSYLLNSDRPGRLRYVGYYGKNYCRYFTLA